MCTNENYSGSNEYQVLKVVHTTYNSLLLTAEWRRHTSTHGLFKAGPRSLLVAYMERQGGCSKTNSLSDEGKRKKVEKSPNAWNRRGQKKNSLFIELLRQPGIEPGACRDRWIGMNHIWQRQILPLNHWRMWFAENCLFWLKRRIW